VVWDNNQPGRHMAPASTVKQPGRSVVCGVGGQGGCLRQWHLLSCLTHRLTVLPCAGTGGLLETVVFFPLSHTG
jgi:hypothetical protein